MSIGTEIYDKFEEAYAVDNFANGMFHVLHRGVKVGHLYCIYMGKVVELCDILINEISPYQGIEILKFLHLQPKTTCYRERGLGTALLSFAFDTYQKMGCERMEGKIVEKDLLEMPWLPRWYRKHGFNIPDSGPGKIWKELNPTMSDEVAQTSFDRR